MSLVKTATESRIIPEAHSSVAESHILSYRKLGITFGTACKIILYLVTHLIENKQLPENGLPEAQIRHLISELALSDRNKGSEDLE